LTDAEIQQRADAKHVVATVNRSLPDVATATATAMSVAGCRRLLFESGFFHQPEFTIVGGVDHLFDP
jgi:hypothetical protein